MGFIKKTGIQIDPHAPKKVCDALAQQDKIYGCGKLFKLVRNNNDIYIAELCEYI